MRVCVLMWGYWLLTILLLFFLLFYIIFSCQNASQVTLFLFIYFFWLHINCSSRCVKTITATQKLIESVIEINSVTPTLSTVSIENHFVNCAWQCVICFLQYKGQACTLHLCVCGWAFEDSISRASSTITPTVRIQSGPQKPDWPQAYLAPMHVIEAYCSFAQPF